MKRIVLAFLFLCALPLFGQPVQVAIGDLVVINPPVPSSVGFPTSPLLSLLDSSGKPKRVTNVAASAIAFGADGHLLAGIGASITAYDDFLINRLWTWTGAPSRDNVSALAVAPNGNIYALTFSSDVLEISPDRSNVRRIVLPDIGFPVAKPALDLSADGCTLFYFNRNLDIARYDVCAGAALQPFLPGTKFEAFRVMSDGGIVASRNEALEFYDPAGRLLKSIVVSGSPATSIAFDADPAYVWAGVPLYLAKVRISDGAHVVVITRVVYGLLVRGERRPGSFDLVVGRRRGARH